VFLPCILPRDSSWMSSTRLSAYQDFLDCLTRTFPIDDPESRADSYFVGYSHFGIKFRVGKVNFALPHFSLTLAVQGGRMLEMKLRRKKSKTIPGGEIWEKKKLGEEALSCYRNKIVKHVGEFCYQELGIQAEVSKVRSSYAFGGCSLEICLIDAGSLGRIPRPWLSLAIEGEESSILRNIQENERLRALWGALAINLELLTECRHSALEESFFPVLSGYPGWLCAIYSSCPNHFNEPIFDDVKSLIEIKDESPR
jgi:hypothetical protein